MKKRALALLMSLALLVGMLPAAFAAEGSFTVTGGTAGTDYAVTDGVLRIKTGKSMTVSGGTMEEPMTGSILVEAGVTANLTFDKLYLTAPEYSPAVRVEKTATLNLSMGEDETDLDDGSVTTPAAILTGGKGRAGIEVPQTATLVVKEGGTLKVTAGEKGGSSKFAAGIGGSAVNTDETKYSDGVGTIQLSGGKIEAYGAYDSYGHAQVPGIGTGRVDTSEYTNAGHIIIDGTANVTAVGCGNTAIGIYSISTSSLSNQKLSEGDNIIEIRGGTVVTKQYDYTLSNPLKGGDIALPTKDSVGVITIDGGDVTANMIGGNNCTVNISGTANITISSTTGNIGGDTGPIIDISGGQITAKEVNLSNEGLPRIGGGNKDKRGSVHISDGEINVVSSAHGTGIGGDYCDVFISGGTVTAQGYNTGTGIGAGKGGDVYHGTVTISGGTVNAYGGGESGGSASQYSLGAGIGTGAFGFSSKAIGEDAKITIVGGVVTALGGKSGFGHMTLGIGRGTYTGEDRNTVADVSGWFSTDGSNGSAYIVTNGIGDNFSLDNENWSGAIINNVQYDRDTKVMTMGTGKVRGDVTLAQSLELPKGAVVDIANGSSLTVAEDVTLTMPTACYNPPPLVDTRTAEENGYYNTTINNHGTINDYGTLTIAERTDLYQDDFALFVNESDGVFNWYGTVNGSMDTTAPGNIVNYPSAVTVSVDKSSPTYGDEVVFTATVQRVEKDSNNTAITAAGGVVDFYLDGADTPFVSENAVLSNGALTASTSVYTLGQAWKAGSSHTVTAKYRDGEGVTGSPKAQQLPAEAAQGVSVTVGKKALADAMVGAIDDVTFNGSEQKPAVTVTHTVNGGNAITANDYTVTYANNIDAGTATVTVSATDSGNYSGAVTKNFTIRKAASDPATVTVTKNLYYAKANQVQVDLAAAAGLKDNRGETTYTVSAVTGANSILNGSPTVSGNVLSFATNSGNVDDTASFTVTAEMKNYTDVTFNVTVTLKDKTLVTISGVSVAGAVNGEVTYSGVPAAYTGTPTTDRADYADGYAYTWYAVSNGSDALLSAAPKAVGSYKLVVSVPDESELYRGELVVPFTIEKAPLTVTAGSYQVSKEYDGTAAAGTASGELDVAGIKGSDKVTITVVPGAYAAKDAGDGLTVTADLTLSGTDAGNYTLADETVEVPAVIRPKTITIASATVEDKTYDGKTDGKVTSVSFNGLVGGESLEADTGYTAQAAFTTAGAGSNKAVTVTVSLKNGNYTMSENTFNATASIAKATPPAAVGLSVDVANKFAKEYVVKLSNGLAALSAGCEYGNVTYTASATYEMNPDTMIVTVTGGTLTLGMANIDSDVEYEKAFIVSVQAESANYTAVSFDVNVNTVNRTVPIGEPKAEGSLSYGQKLSELILTGTMKDGTGADAETVEGDFAWEEPDSVPAVADTKAVWVFTPKDTETYLEISGEADISVEKAVPNGTPATEPIEGSGKTLGDTALSGTFTNPNDGSAVPGALNWNDALSTEVKVNTAYDWTFTPEDTDNYTVATGALTPWVVNYSGDNIPTGSTSSSTVKNEDGSTTTTVTNKRTGTVTETTKMANGDKLVVETKTDGTVTETFIGKDGSKRETVTNPDGSVTSAITTADGIKTKSEKTAEGQVSSSVILPKSVKDSTVTLPILPAAPGKTELKLTTDVPVKVVAPVTEGGEGTVAVLVKDDGTKEIIKTSVLTEDGLLIPVSSDVTIEVIDNSKSFHDVADDAWYADSVSFVSAREMLTGVGGDTFAPNEPTTRGMLMTILARYAGIDTAGGEVWYDKGMAWAKEQGISDGTAPQNAITREQLATMLYRYADEPETSGSLDAFRDAASVSSYAQVALKWAVEQGIITGKGGGVLDPLGNATRAEVATMLTRFCKSMAK